MIPHREGKESCPPGNFPTRTARMHLRCPRRDSMTTTKSVIARLTLLLAPLFLPLALNHAAAGTRFFCQKTVFPAPRNPCVRYKRICPKPVCPCCPIENFGYFPACWQR